jgi:hypothetical protein
MVYKYLKHNQTFPDTFELMIMRMYDAGTNFRPRHIDSIDQINSYYVKSFMIES